MKKSFLLLFLVVLFTNISSAQFVRIWEKSDALNNLPAWFSPSGTRERGIAYCAFNGIPKLYVISNLSEPTVIILDALTGDSLGVLNTVGIEGGILLLSDISSTPGDLYWYPFTPALFACNLTNNAITSHYKIYKWESDTDAPQLVVEDSLSAFRIGDHLNISMDIFPFQKLLLNTASSNNNKVINYYSYTGGPPFIRKEITLSDGNMGSNASADYNYVYPFFDQGSYIVNSDGFSPKFYDTLGVFQLISDTSVVSSSSNSIKYYANGTLCCDLPFYTTYNYAENNASLVLSQGPPWETLWGETPSLGNNPNPEQYGDVEYTWLHYDSLLIFVLAGNNGIGAYFAPGLSLPVELISFTAEKIDDEVVLKWQTATETNNSGFEIQRTLPRPSPYQGEGGEAGRSWEKIGFVEGKGTTSEITNYIFKDKINEPGTYSYRLKQIDFDGSFTYGQVVEVDISSPTEFMLYQNYPNPFNPTTKIEYSTDVEGLVVLKVYDILGKEVKTLVHSYQQSGIHEIIFDGTGLSSGIYYCQLESNNRFLVKKLLLMK